MIRAALLLWCISAVGQTPQDPWPPQNACVGEFKILHCVKTVCDTDEDLRSCAGRHFAAVTAALEFFPTCQE